MAIIDLGTNAVRFEVARVIPGQRHEVIADEREEVRLGEGLYAATSLTQEAMDRTVAAIGRFARLSREFGVRAMRAVATSAVREADNGAAFCRRVERETGVRLEVITGDAEARLIARGVLGAGSHPGDRVLIDIGGGSTELTLVRQGVPQGSWSLALGAVRLTELHLHRSDPPTARELQRLRRHAATALAELPRKKLPADVEMVGSAGTIGALAEIMRRRKGQSSVRSIGSAELEKLLRELAAMPLSSRRKVAGLDGRRAEIVVAGAAILLEAMAWAGADQTRPTRRGLRDGLLLDLVATVDPAAAGTGGGTAPEESVRSLLRRCAADEVHAGRVRAHALAIYDAIAGTARFGGDAREILSAAALLHEIGRIVGQEKYHKHTWYLIDHAELPGISERQRELIALVARYHRKSPPKPGHDPFRELPARSQLLVRQLAAILRVANALECRRRPKLETVRAHMAERTLELVLPIDDTAGLERWAVEEKARPIFEAALDISLHLATCAPSPASKHASSAIDPR